MNILMMAQHFAPEETSGGVLATELAYDLLRLGHQVHFVTCAPNYPSGVVYPGYRNQIISREERGGVTVIRTWSYITPKRSFWSRVLNFGTFSVMAFLGGLAAGRPDMIFSYSPPLTLGISAWLLSRMWGVPWILRVEDIYPRAAVVSGVLRARMLIRMLENLERFLYHQAAHISLISPSFQKDLIQRGVPPAKLSTLSVWADPDQIRPLGKDNRFRREHGLLGKFVVLYAGNLGHTSEFEDVFCVADLLRDDPSIHFVLVGDGVKREELQRSVFRRGLPNILLLPYQPREGYAEVLAAADVGLVTLNRNSAACSLPSKVFNIMASKRPVLAVAPVQSDLAGLVQKYSCGIVVEPGNPKELHQAIMVLKTRSQPGTDHMGRNGREALIAHFSRHRIIQQFDQLLRETAFHGHPSVHTGDL